ncbi:uncharacterized protein TA13630 [Theileria annulata]|uniref:CS domain-containing protein n=1 Tax=Theileria annulata TaxID=5874 RepID=Q4UDC5_THEAN|nr:uncharacterized protein TA13630 [Theileria annulata]CAI74914.1 hypothetical protein TA13630 [Theileria annulata]|eukprot:XP_952646.1 hypothetical protein TA13630 [Theileria annulata]
MVKYAIFIKTIGFVTTLSNLPLLNSYLFHGRIVKFNTFSPNPITNFVDEGRPRKYIFEKHFDESSDDSTNDTLTPDNNSTILDNPNSTLSRIIPADEEIVKRLAERHKDEITRYMRPLESGLGKQIPDSEIESTFGKPMTPENLSKRENESIQHHPYNMPIIPPTNKLPYFVNLDCYPSNSTHDINTQPINTAPPTTPKEPEPLEAEEPEPLEAEEPEPPIPSTTVEDNTVNDETIVKSTFSTGLPLNMESKDPLRALIDRNEPYPDLGEEYGPKWYLNNDDKVGELSEVELEDGWSILPCRRIYKHILQPSALVGKHRARPVDKTCVTFKFTLMDAFTNKKIVDNEDVGGPMVTTYMQELEPAFYKCLKGMDTGEQAEFVFHVSEYNPDNMIIDELEGITWLRLWINLWESHDPDDRWWGLGPEDAHLYPEKTENDLPKFKQLEIETDKLTSQIETELCTNPSSPLWNDILDKMTTSQKESYVKHFDRQLENIHKMKHSEFTGSRAFGEKIKSTGQLKGYDLGHQVGGVSKFFAWRETPFMMYIAIPVIPGVRAEHVNLDLSPNHMVLKIANNTVIDDDLIGTVDLEMTGLWAMSDSALNFEPLDHADERLKNPTLELLNDDEYDKISAKPSIMIFLKKTGTSTSIWGTPFVNI